MFSPGSGGLFLLLQLPVLLSVILAIPLLLSWRKFYFLVLAALASAAYLLVALSLLEVLIGVLMLMISAWAVVLFLALALWLSSPAAKDQARRSEASEFPSTLPLDRGPPYHCPRCLAAVPAAHAECSFCGARRHSSQAKLGEDARSPPASEA